MSAPVLGRERAELQEPRLLRVQLQVELAESLLKLCPKQIIQTRVGSRQRTVGFRLAFGWEKRKALNGSKSIAALTDAEQLESSKDRGG